MPAVLVIDNLCRSYDRLAAVDHLSLQVPAGGRHAIIGPNGAGKTTLLNLISGQLRPHSGTVSLAGRDITRYGVAARARLGIGRIHQQPAVLGSLTARDNIIAAAWPRAGGLRPAVIPRYFDRDLIRPALATLARFGLADVAAAPADQLAHGQRRQLEIAMALAGQPRLLLLDEPAAGLSPGAIDLLSALLASLPAEITVVLVEHHLDLVDAYADTVTVLQNGREVFTGPPAALRSSPLVQEAYPMSTSPC
ncbi:MAG: ATP-binding cassette domain-containing protein [Micromonosporaceae bacterium]|nr:ATP-binding cassette domain-containing protein [Micromonosporaceae bacterium]